MAISLIVASWIAAPTSATILGQVAKILAPDGEAGDWFGNAVASSGDTMIVGSPTDDDNGIDSGSVYIFVRNMAGNWKLQTKLIASDGAAGDLFGIGVAISGDTVIVGACFDTDNGIQSGSAYIFARDATGAWTQQAKLLASDGAPFDRFGGSVATNGDTAIVGAYHDAVVGPFSGSAYVFTLGPFGVWTQQTKLTPNDTAPRDEFGGSIAMSNDMAIIGSFLDDDNGFNSGSAYIFARNKVGVWTQQAKLRPADGAANDLFGASVAISGETSIVGAFRDDDNGMDSGSAYVFARSTNGIWTQQKKLKAADGATGDYFGLSVSIAGKVSIVGATRDDDACPDDTACDSGSAYIFTSDTTGLWTQQAKLLAADGAQGDKFGISQTINRNTVVIGAFLHDDNMVDSGAVYTFDLALLPTCKADMNGDGMVNASDLATLLAQWGGPGAADLTGDGIVNAADLATLHAAWGPCP